MQEISHSMMTSEEIENFLGYDDLRSVKKWCKDNGVPLMKIGKRYMAHSWTIEIAFLKLLREESFNCGHDGDAVIEAIANDDKTSLASLMESPLDEAIGAKFARKKGSVEKTIEKFKRKSA